MQCEMCGEEIRGAPKLVRVEGAELQVCMKCGKFGTEVQQVRRTDLRAAPKAAGGPPCPGTCRRNSADMAQAGHVRLHGRGRCG